MSPTSLGQRGKKKKKAGCPGRGRLLAGSERGFATASGALGFWQEPRQVSASQPQQLAFPLACLDVLPAAAHVSGQGVFWFLFFFLGRKHKKNVTTPHCLPLSPDFGCCLEMSPNIVPKCLERLRAACGSHRSHRSRVGSCTAAPGGAAKQTQTHHQAERSQPLAFRAGKTHYNHLSCKE